MENPKNQLATKLKEANNVLVTVSTNPTVDQISAAIGLTLFLTRLKKHATTVFSGQIPSTIDFLKPEETIETNTDSLRDFIISLDKAKADKIRYKVEDTMVKIFITPYRTSITDQDLVFSQGDFNVDVVVALGIQNREDIDQAIMAHGRILHDAVVATVNLGEGSDIGTLNWTDSHSSSLCEMMVMITDLLKANSLDGQMATAFLTGIVAETERFSNEKTSSNTMNASAKLMAAGANQQLVATKLQPPDDESPREPKSPQDPGDQGSDGDVPKDAMLEDDGSLRINHPSSIPEADDSQNVPPVDMLPQPWTPEGLVNANAPESMDEQYDPRNRPMLDTPPQPLQQDDGLFGIPSREEQNSNYRESNTNSKIVTEPPQYGGQLSAAANDVSDDTNPLNLPPVSMPMLSRKPEPQHQEASEKPEEDGPPEPYTVFDPEPQKPETEQVAPPSPPEPTANFPRAVEPVGLRLPTPPPPTPASVLQSELPKQIEKPSATGHSFVDMGDKTLDQIEEKVASPPPASERKPIEPDESVDYKQEAVNHIAKVMSDKTLDQIEEKVGKTHKQSVDEPKEEIDYKQEAAKHVAKVMSDKTLDKIEEKVHSPHLEKKADVIPAEKTKKEEVSALSYEPHESEPKEKIEKSEGAKTANAEPVDKPKTDEKQKSEKEADSSPVAAKKPEVAATLSTPANLKKSDKPQTITPEPKKKPEPTPAPEAEKAKQDEARDAVMRAINAGGDGRTSLPPLEAVGTAGAMEVSHSEATGSDNQAESSPPPVPPPMPATPRHTGPSPNISIDPEDGTLIPLPPNLVPNSDELPADVTAAASEASPPPVPPPMVPPVQKV